MLDDKRSFSVVRIELYNHRQGRYEVMKNKEYGRYISKTPAGAAKKACSKFCNSGGKCGASVLNIVIRETTAGSSKKEFKYKYFRRDENKTVVRNGVEIHYKYLGFIKSSN
jgi:hypothetical protein